MQIFPAIDLLDSKAVRLTKGEKSSAKIYGEALDFARYFKECGAKWVHIIDLDGAFSGSPKNLDVIESIVKHTGLKVQVGGGIRNETAIKKYIDIGVSRVILGSVALRDSEFCKEMARIYPIGVSIDSKDGFVATHGWVTLSSQNALDFALRFKDSQVQTLICTDISRDGLLSGINVELTKAIAQNSGLFTIASGGFSGQEDLKRVGQCGVDGIIIGKAFYEGGIDLKKTNFGF